MSTVYTVGVVAAALAALHAWGGVSGHSTARVSTWRGALDVAEWQRARPPFPNPWTLT